MTHYEIEPGLVIRQGARIQPLKQFKVIAFDMDSTLINIECIDEIADAAGKKAEVAALTEAAMRGEITDFKDSLRRRLALLRGVSVSHLEAVYTDRLKLNPGAETLLAACREAGLYTVLVSGGFTFFASRVQARLEIDFARSNELELIDGALTGDLISQDWGTICDGDMKKTTLQAICAQVGCHTTDAIAVGDGANDLPMMSVAGLSVAYHAKEKVRQQADVAINTGGLDALCRVLVD
jgi:phosphoserine phosphatase